jgi:protein-S-isoprenylcysteine O-methyltransferase Ste14
MTVQRCSRRDVVFAHRGALLAIPAVILVLIGKPAVATPTLAIGLVLAFGGELLRCWAVGYSGVTTRADTVTAPALVTAGPYAYVRNPLYIGNFITAIGFAIAFTGGNDGVIRAVLIALSLSAMLAVYAVIIPHEEAYLHAMFGASFDTYVAHVPALLPRLTPWEVRCGAYDPSTIIKAETRTFLTFGAMLAALAIKAYFSGVRSG